MSCFLRSQIPAVGAEIVPLLTTAPPVLELPKMAFEKHRNAGPPDIEHAAIDDATKNRAICGQNNAGSPGDRAAIDDASDGGRDVRQAYAGVRGDRAIVDYAAARARALEESGAVDTNAGPIGRDLAAVTMPPTKVAAF